MPYIPAVRRAALAEVGPTDVGELTFALTDICLQRLPSSPRFADFAEVVAALECAKLEFYRRAVAPYEDRKRADNGDCYPS